MRNDSVFRSQAVRQYRNGKSNDETQLVGPGTVSLLWIPVVLLVVAAVVTGLRLLQIAGRM